MNKLRVLIIVLGIIIVVAIVSCTPVAPSEGAAANFYKGKRIEVVTTGTPGGSDDLLARLIASRLSEQLGSSVIVNNRSGAGGMEGMNYVYKSKPDGLTHGIAAMTPFISNQVLNDPVANYDISKFSYIMSVDHVPMYFFTSPEGPYQSIDALRAGKDLKILGSSPSGTIALGGLTIIKILSLDAKVVTGFRGESNRALAIKRGEAIGYCLDIPTTRASVASGMIKPLFVIATERDPLMPDVPSITELVDLTGEDLSLVKLWETAFVSSSLYTASPDIPGERLILLRNLAASWSNDEKFRQAVNQAFGYEVSQYSTGDEVTKSMLDVAASLEKFQAMFLELIEKYRA